MQVGRERKEFKFFKFYGLLKNVGQALYAEDQRRTVIQKCKERTWLRLVEFEALGTSSKDSGCTCTSTWEFEPAVTSRFVSLSELGSSLPENPEGLMCLYVLLDERMRSVNAVNTSGMNKLDSVRFGLILSSESRSKARTRLYSFSGQM